MDQYTIFTSRSYSDVTAYEFSRDGIVWYTANNEFKSVLKFKELRRPEPALAEIRAAPLSCLSSLTYGIGGREVPRVCTAEARPLYVLDAYPQLVFLRPGYQPIPSPLLL